MTVENRDVWFDLVSVDPLTGIVYLTLIEEREWGEAGKLRPDLQGKLNHVSRIRGERPTQR